jgi:uncharacterized membrane protein YebE (DUF533 family)
MLKGLAGGAALGGLASMVLGSKKSSNLAKTAVKVGGAAAIGGLAWKAWQAYQASQNTPAVQSDETVFLPTQTSAQNDLSLALLTAMIAAAKADGHIDAAEQRRIFTKLDDAELDAEAKAFLMDELRKPLDIDAIVKLATSPEVAVEIYTASVLAIDPDDPAEQAYLAMLAARLKLAPELKLEVEKQAKQPAV